MYQHDREYRASPDRLQGTPKTARVLAEKGPTPRVLSFYLRLANALAARLQYLSQLREQGA